jgi:hypothetical protein
MANDRIARQALAEPVGNVSDRPVATLRTVRLPRKQSARAACVVLLYSLAVALVAVLLTYRFGDALGGLLTAFWAFALLVPLAIAAPRPRPAEEADQTQLEPVLKRQKRGR